MVYAVLGAWVVQSAVGASLALSWWRHGRHHLPTVRAHVVSLTLGLVSWVAFVVTQNPVAAWTALVVMTIGNAYGDDMLLRRVHSRTGTTSKRRNYPVAIRAIFRGEMPARVAFHAVFAGVVYFGSLGVCIAATVSAG